MLDETSLQKIATDEAGRLVRGVLQGQIEITPEPCNAGWDPLLKRDILRQPTVAWLAFDRVQITVNEQGRVVLFVDENRFKEAKYEELADSDILQICATSGLLGPRAKVIEKKADPRGVILAIVEQRQLALPKRIRFAVNAGLRMIAALQVLEDA